MQKMQRWVSGLQYLFLNGVALHGLDHNDMIHSPFELWCSIRDFFFTTNELHCFLTTSTMASLQESGYAGRQFTFVLFHWDE